ncbi:CusA/CzcA family heavy metal efflux RND transporter [Polluticaenibacter yanchengensis]|uniref:CusA/CzcA family heavy metal efflux RND transporter n=1 Tax=Polluticaenibacter yanchengensis TaxID=3014562 RepID=A0ABT4UM37_9BACT|nr:CusA/CzcA family heavy metal efflux RND transporter [Chitinophagaceae bacterium LY-5]
MLNKIILFSIRNKLIIGFLTLMLIVWGVWSASKLPVDAVPDITQNQVQIFSYSPNLAAQEVEQYITYPIEQSIATVPHITETRSISRFGLCVITVVFDEDIDIYFARQLINEKLNEVSERIPKHYGKPELTPVSTGLGEIYQYVLKVKEAQADKYSATELRTIQDWIVARQLYGIRGVAEVSSLGGYKKQYEVAVSPERLRSMGVSITDVFDALEKNNQNIGGAYIEKNKQAYFIRSIGVITSLEDIRSVVVKQNMDGVPIFIGDVAEVQYGSAIRYGALTIDGKSEAVGGIVLMLKGANSNEVTELVKSKIEQINKSLPEGITIEPFLERTSLVERAINTVKNNLIEGALIVIFVLIIFLGNIRAGLIVASAIPLSLLFAFGMMYLFGVSANLMSLGAIDFGLIVDGSLIVVEATVHHLGIRKKTARLTQYEMDMEVYESAAKIRSSAALGEVIIMIVYVPILSLVGIEGKMFKPMAQTVVFAILGALILSLTYIPMMCALALSKKTETKESFADKLIARLQRWYSQIIHKAITIRKTIVAVTVSAFIISVIMFSRMGGEFIPQLQEGDFAFHCILPQGSSLNQSIRTSMQAERIIKSFDEVEMVVGKTGTGEIPTDPMPPEATDMIIALKPKSEWKRDISYKELATEMMDDLKIIPGVFFESTQPIQMRFNELMTGVRQDVAVKVFGENIDTLAMLAQKVSGVIATVKGATAPQVERTAGLPQISIEYNRVRLAGYNLSIDDVNRSVNTAFTGAVTGSVYENERNFDLVVRLDSAHRSSLDNVGNLLIATPNGNQVPLSQIANISIKESAAQISREGGKRRIVVGFNVSGRDVQSVVTEIEDKLDRADLLPAGYTYEYGGSFENLKEASARLSIAVPIALFLIFMLLYLTFHSVKQALLIYTAIPMSAIGGVVALYLRDMPFSISAGVGFIALFGVAVLNGIVLISTFNQLEKDGIKDVFERVYKGTEMRLRPVLMTATVASLGFLPMAISTGAGAEVQKPLATVVIGGIITATFLTLVSLPCLYIIFSKRKKLAPKMTLPVILLAMLGISNTAGAQIRIAPDAAVDTAFKANLNFTVAGKSIAHAQALTKSVSIVNKTGVFVENEDLRPSDNKGIMKIGISQSVEWPGLYAARKNYLTELATLQQMNIDVLKARIKRDVHTSYYQLWFLQDKIKLYRQLDSIYSSLYKAADLRVKTGEAAGLERIAANVQMKETQVLASQLQKGLEAEQLQLMMLLNAGEAILPLNSDLQKMALNIRLKDSSVHPEVNFQLQDAKSKLSEIDMIKQEQKPDFSGRFFSQRLWGAKDPFTGFSVSANIPIFNRGANQQKIKAAEFNYQASVAQADVLKQQFSTQVYQQLQIIQKHQQQLSFYEEVGLKQSEEIIKAATLSYKSGEISYAELTQFMSQAVNTKLNYLETLNNYNHAVVLYQYLQND